MKENKTPVTIKCPKCNSYVQGVITTPEYGYFTDYSGYCEKCDYHIGESEFKEVEK